MPSGCTDGDMGELEGKVAASPRGADDSKTIKIVHRTRDIAKSRVDIDVMMAAECGERRLLTGRNHYEWHDLSANPSCEKLQFSL